MCVVLAVCLFYGCGVRYLYNFRFVVFTACFCTLPIHFMFVVLYLFFGNVCGVHHSFKALWCSPLHRAGLVLFRGLADCAPAQTDGGEPA